MCHVVYIRVFFLLIERQQVSMIKKSLSQKNMSTEIRISKERLRMMYEVLIVWARTDIIFFYDCNRIFYNKRSIFLMPRLPDIVLIYGNCHKLLTSFHELKWNYHDGKNLQVMKFYLQQNVFLTDLH